jgi:hypothetical protein
MAAKPPENTHSPAQTKPQKPYVPPALMRYGSLASLTQGGSRGTIEHGNPMGNGQARKLRT